MGALPEDAELLEPRADARRMPAVAVARDDAAGARRRDRRGASRCCPRPRPRQRTASLFSSDAVVYRSGWCFEVAAVADEVPEEDQLVLAPGHARRLDRQASRQRNARARTAARRACSQPSPASTRCSAVARSTRPLAVATLEDRLDARRSRPGPHLAATTFCRSSTASTRGRCAHEIADRGTRRPSASTTSVSPVTHSRRSDITGFLSVRCSTLRLSCDSAMTGACSSFASALSEREISEISVARFSLVPGHLHELQVVDHDQAELALVLALQAPRARAHFGGRERRRCRR